MVRSEQAGLSRSYPSILLTYSDWVTMWPRHRQRWTPVDTHGRPIAD